MWLYTTIIHPVRQYFNLTEREYCIIDTIAQLSANPSASKAGWCNASNITIAKWLGSSPKTVIAAIEKGKKIGLLDVEEQGDGIPTLKRATKKWFEVVNTLLPKVTPPVTKGNTPLLPKVTPPVTKGNTDNNIDIDIDTNKNDGEFDNSQQSTHFDLSPKKQENQEKEKKVAQKKEKEVQRQQDEELTEQEQLVLKEAKEASRTPTHAEILKTPKPFDVNEGVFYALRVFGASRQQRAKSRRMTAAAWQRMIRECQKASTVFAPQQIINLIEIATAREYQSPFFDGYQELIKKQNATNNNQQSTIGSDTPTTGDKVAGAIESLLAERLAYHKKPIN